MKNKLSTASLCILLAFLLSACGESKISNQPPQVFIADLQIQQEQLQIQLQIRNINLEAMLNSQISFKFKLAGIDVFNGDKLLNLSLDSKGTEQISWVGTPNTGAMKLLQRLGDGSLKSLDYHLTGQFVSGTKGKKSDIKQAGKVFAVPGKPGHFRLAGISGNTRLNHDRASGSAGH